MILATQNACDDPATFKNLKKVTLIDMTFNGQMESIAEGTRRSAAEPLLRTHEQNDGYFRPLQKNEQRYFDGLVRELLQMTATASPVPIVPITQEQRDLLSKQITPTHADYYYTPMPYLHLDVVDYKQSADALAVLLETDAVMAISFRLYVEALSSLDKKGDFDPFRGREGMYTHRYWRMHIRPATPSTVRMIANVVVLDKNGILVFNRDVEVKESARSIYVMMSDITEFDISDSVLFERLGEKMRLKLADILSRDY
ncbi:MAG: hypothetical protein O3A01_01650 [bacterium]|nr:hypothetical protein [bacterium]